MCSSTCSPHRQSSPRRTTPFPWRRRRTAPTRIGWPCAGPDDEDHKAKAMSSVAEGSGNTQGKGIVFSGEGTVELARQCRYLEHIQQDRLERHVGLLRRFPCSAAWERWCLREERSCFRHKRFCLPLRSYRPSRPPPPFHLPNHDSERR